MFHNKNILAFLIIVLFSLLAAGTAAAEEQSYQSIPSDAQNKEHLDAAITHTEEALAAAKAGDGKTTHTHTKAAVAELREINSERWAPTLQPTTGKIRVGGIKAKKGDLDAAITLIEPSITALKGLK